MQVGPRSFLLHLATRKVTTLQKTSLRNCLKTTTSPFKLAQCERESQSCVACALFHRCAVQLNLVTGSWVVDCFIGALCD